MSIFIFSFRVEAFTITTSPDPCNKTISGSVIDSATNEVVPYALIIIEGSDKGVFSDKKGHFHFDSLCVGTYTLNCHLLGYKKIIKTIKVERSLKLLISLPQSNIELNEVNVETERIKRELIQTQSSVKGKELDQTRGNSLAESLTGITGVTVIKTGPSISKPVIHGMHSNRILILNNGVRQEGQQWGSEHAPEIDPFVASELTVVKGAASIRYGADAIAGVIIVNPKPLRRDHGYHAEVNLVGLSNNRQGVISGIVEGNPRQIEGLAFRLQGTFKRAGNSFAPSYNLGNTGFQEFNFSGALGYSKGSLETSVFYSQFNNTLGILSKSHIGNTTDLRNQIENNYKDTASFTYKIASPKQEVLHQLLKINSKLKTDAGAFNLTYAYQHNSRQEFDAHKRQTNSSQLQFDLYTNTLDLQWEHSLSNKIEGSIGSNGMMQANIYSGRKLVPNFTSYSSGIYWIEKYSTQKFQLEGGIRYDYKWLKSYENIKSNITTNNLNWSNVSGTLGATYFITNDLKVQATAGSAWRAPSINELFIDGLHHGSSVIEKGDIDLGVEKAYNFNALLNYSYSKFSAEVSLYYNLIDNYIYLQPDTAIALTSAGAFRMAHYSQVNASFKGLDADLKFKLSNSINLSSKASIVRVINRDTKSFIVGIPPDRFTQSISYLIGDLYNVKDLLLSLSNVSVLRQTRVEANADFSAPPKGYSIFSSEISFNFPMKKTKINIGMTINNILNTSYRDYLNAFRYFVDEPGRNFTLRTKILFN